MLRRMKLRRLSSLPHLHTLGCWAGGTAPSGRGVGRFGRQWGLMRVLVTKGAEKGSCSQTYLPTSLIISVSSSVLTFMLACGNPRLNQNTIALRTLPGLIPVPLIPFCPVLCLFPKLQNNDLFLRICGELRHIGLHSVLCMSARPSDPIPNPIPGD